MMKARSVFHILTLLVGFTLASAFGATPAPSPGDDMPKFQPKVMWFYPAGIDLLWWLRR